MEEIDKESMCLIHYANTKISFIFEMIDWRFVTLCWITSLSQNRSYVCNSIKGSAMLLLFNFQGPLPKIGKNVKICPNTFSRNYLCQKIVQGRWQSWIFRDPLNSTKFGCFTKITCRGPFFKVRYKCYTFSETSGQPLKGGEERKVKNGQENLCYGL